MINHPEWGTPILGNSHRWWEQFCNSMATAERSRGDARPTRSLVISADTCETRAPKGPLKEGCAMWVLEGRKRSAPCFPDVEKPWGKPLVKWCTVPWSVSHIELLVSPPMRSWKNLPDKHSWHPPCIGLPILGTNISCSVVSPPCLIWFTTLKGSIPQYGYRIPISILTSTPRIPIESL